MSLVMINYSEVVMVDVSIVHPQGGALVFNMDFCVQCVDHSVLINHKASV